MTRPRGETDGDAGDPSEGPVLPLERTAPVYVEVSNGYVDIRQPEGDPTQYTPEEARDIAREILGAAAAAEPDRE